MSVDARRALVCCGWGVAFFLALGVVPRGRFTIALDTRVVALISQAGMTALAGRALVHIVRQHGL